MSMRRIVLWPLRIAVLGSGFNIAIQEMGA